MLKYLVILLSDDAVSYCHYTAKEYCSNKISPEILKKAIIWAMKENLSVQFVYSHNSVDDDIRTLINSIDHIEIAPQCYAKTEPLSEDVIVVHDGWDELELKPKQGQSIVIHTSLNKLLCNKDSLVELLKYQDRINIVIIDVENFKDCQVKDYQNFLESLLPIIIEEYKKDHHVQLNLLTDRIMLKEMNNCNAGNESITLGPDGKFYICPAFYLNSEENIGDIDHGLEIKNPQLYRLDHAPICRICDAFQCKRCIWLNKKMCHEVNTPSHQQCIMAHVERNASKKLLEEFRKIDSSFMSEIDIQDVDYLDPFDKVTKQIQ